MAPTKRSSSCAKDKEQKRKKAKSRGSLKFEKHMENVSDKGSSSVIGFDDSVSDKDSSSVIDFNVTEKDGKSSQITKHKSDHSNIQDSVSEKRKKGIKSPKIIKSDNVCSSTHDPVNEKKNFEKKLVPRKSSSKHKHDIIYKKKNIVTKKSSKSLWTSALKEGEKPNWTVVRKVTKKLKIERKKHENIFYELSANAKSLWEKIRRADCPTETRSELLVSLYDLLKGSLQKIVFAHDTARIIQCLLKLSTPDICLSVTKELEPSLLLMIQKKYSSTCIKKILKYGTTECRDLLLKSFKGNVTKLMAHSVAAPILDMAYSEFASPQQKKVIRSEFFGKVFKVSCNQDVDNINNIAEAVSKFPELKNNILRSAKKHLLHIINKGLVFLKLTQVVACDFLNVCTPADKEEIVALFQPYVVDLLNSKEGVHISMMCCWLGTTKNKKVHMKNMKGRVQEFASMEHSFMFLLALMDSVDDTVLLKKAILGELVENASTIVTNEYGRKVILYVVAHRDPAYFHPSFIKFLETGDTTNIAKKNMDVRQKEILEYVLPPLLKSIESDTPTWFANSSVAMVVLGIMKNRQISDDLWLNAANSIVKYVCSTEAKVVEGDKTFRLIEHSGCNLVLKKLIQADKLHPDKAHFSTCLSQEINLKTMKYWIKYNRGCFLLIYLLESGIKDAMKILRKKCEESIKRTLEAQSFVGATILLQKLSECKVKC